MDQHCSPGSLLVRTLVCVSLTVTCSTVVVAQDIEEIAQDIVEALYESGVDRPETEQVFFFPGLAKQDADRIFRGFIDGFVLCLLTELQSYSEQNSASFSDELHDLDELLRRSGVGPVLTKLAMIAGGTAPDASCALNEMQNAGISMDLLLGNTKQSGSEPQTD